MTDTIKRALQAKLRNLEEAVERNDFAAANLIYAGIGTAYQSWLYALAIKGAEALAITARIEATLKPTRFGRPGEPLEYDSPVDILAEDATPLLSPAPVCDNLGRTRWAVRVPINADGDDDLDWFHTKELADTFCRDWQGDPA